MLRVMTDPTIGGIEIVGREIVGREIALPSVIPTADTTKDLIGIVRKSRTVLREKAGEPGHGKNRIPGDQPGVTVENHFCKNHPPASAGFL